MKFSRFIPFLFTLAIVAFGTSCGGDDSDDEMMATPKEGCTTEQSDNYDADADTDDGSCIPWNEKFIATFASTRVDAAGSFPTQTGDLIITAGSGPLDLNMAFRTNTWTAVITDKLTIEIPEQDAPNSLKLTGSGAIDGDEITMTLTYAAGGSTTYNLTGTRK